KMLTPSAGLSGVKDFIMQTVKEAGPNACPPLVVGIGIGGNFGVAPYRAKKSLFRPVGERHPVESIADLEREIHEAVNKLGSGPQALGGDTTATDIKIETAPCPIAALPVAFNLNCHASRHKNFVI